MLLKFMYYNLTFHIGHEANSTVGMKNLPVNFIVQ